MEVFLEQISILPKGFKGISKRSLFAARDYSLQFPLEETCGIITKNSWGDIFIPCENISPRPDVHFQIKIDIFLENEVLFVYHSHIGGYSAYPSRLDQIYSDELCIPFIIYSLSKDSFFVYENIGV